VVTVSLFCRFIQVDFADVSMVQRESDRSMPRYVCQENSNRSGGMAWYSVGDWPTMLLEDAVEVRERFKPD
jgi:hypothetical protein